MEQTKLLKAFDPEADSENIALAAATLAAGGLVAIPTETVYGLAANALDSAAVGKIFVAKGRPQDNPLIVHISDLEMLAPLVLRVPEAARVLADRFWPGPLTLVLPRSEAVPPIVSAGLPTVAVRLPSHPVARAIIRQAGVPLAAPSANLSGRPSTTTAQHCITDLTGKVDMIVDAGPCPVGIESTVLSLMGETPRLLRPGAVTLEQLQEVLGRVEVDRLVLQQAAAEEPVASPGMKYKHYAPRARVTLVQGDDAQYAAYVNAHREEGTFALCFTGDLPHLAVPAVDYGPKGDQAEQARRLFGALRLLDMRGARWVLARYPSQEQMGLALCNRLLRSAGFEVVRL